MSAIFKPEATNNIGCGQMEIVTPCVFIDDVKRKQEIKNREGNANTVRFGYAEINEVEGLETDLILYID